MGEHPKYQWNCFIDPNRMEQFVVRCDDPQEFVEAIQFVVTTFLQRTSVQEYQSDQEPEIPPDQCTLHNVTMKKRQSKNGAISWYDHRWQEDGIWHTCNGKVVKTG